jgi:predicted ATPase
VAQHLPEQITSFVGRETQIADLQCLAAADRVVTLTAAGGVGKTRLALETVIHEAAGREHRVGCAQHFKQCR